MALHHAWPEEGEQFPKIRQKHITASVVSCLFGENDYTTAWQLWNDMALGAQQRKGSLVASLGQILEPAIAEAFEHHHTMSIEKETAYIYDDELRFGASLDFRCYRYNDRDFDGGIPFDIKMANEHAWRTKWKSGKEVPPAYVFQLLGQMHVTQSKVALLGVMVGGAELHVIEVLWSQPLWDATVERIHAFWKSVEERRQPMPEMKRDAEAIIKRLRHTEKDTSIDLSDDNELSDTVAQYVTLSERVSELGKETRALEKQRTELKATILHKMGEAQFARLRNCVIETKTTDRKAFSVAASSSRSISIKE